MGQQVKRKGGREDAPPAIVVFLAHAVAHTIWAHEHHECQGRAHTPDALAGKGEPRLGRRHQMPVYAQPHRRAGATKTTIRVTDISPCVSAII